MENRSTTDPTPAGPQTHPNNAICPHCHSHNPFSAELLRDSWEVHTCGICGDPMLVRGLIVGDAQNGGYLIETTADEAAIPLSLKGYAIPDEATPPGGNSTAIPDDQFPFTVDDPMAGEGPGGRSGASPEIARGEKLSDSHTCYRRRFEIEGDRLMGLGIAAQAGQEALNRYWQDLGRDLGFVWTTVADLGTDIDKVGGTVRASFTAEVEDVVPHSPAFEQWWRESRTRLPALRNEIAREAYDAGSRHAATVLARLDGNVIEIVREVEVEQDQAQPSLVLALGMAALYGAAIGTGGTLAVLYFGGWIW